MQLEEFSKICVGSVYIPRVVSTNQLNLLCKDCHYQKIQMNLDKIQTNKSNQNHELHCRLGVDLLLQNYEL